MLFLLLTFESQSQTHDPLPHVESNLINHRTLENPKRIKKNYSVAKQRLHKTQTYKSHEICIISHEITGKSQDS